MEERPADADVPSPQAPAPVESPETNAAAESQPALPKPRTRRPSRPRKSATESEETANDSTEPVSKAPVSESPPPEQTEDSPISEAPAAERTEEGDGSDSNAENQGEGNGEDAGGGARRHRNRKSRKERRKEQRAKEREREAAMLEAAPALEMQGIIEISPKGFGFLRKRERNYAQHPDDVFITPEVVRIHGLRDGLWVKCLSKQGVRGPQLIEILEINGKKPEAYKNLPYFEELTAINPAKRLTLETKSDRYTTRVIDLMTPVGRGQRGLIVAPPRTGKTTLLHHIADAILENYEDQMHLMVVLIDERPEEVTDFERSFPAADIYASSNDSDVKNHTRMAQLAIERAKRLVEAGEHVFILLDSITRLARAFNNATGGGKKRGTQSGGLAVGALEIPRRLFAAARNTREAGSLTIIATALIQTNSKMDEAIFQEFKGTGNMELVLDRQLAQNYVYPSIDIHRSGTRREELLLPGHMLEKIHVIRRGLAVGYKPIEAMEWLLKCMERYPSNAQMLMDIKLSAIA
ncbi:MAG: transcription termination factor Rho [Verrucomicrobiae bacterium]|nr:transcription termination factor Rho [Verrucomicrobiae bacterium]MCP5539663.1 transcription termination factor Rho [Akkermansiaceae bacterium]MCP5549401.1 transcription termination factor Rho [Akkermansiaceae bacterium]